MRIWYQGLIVYEQFPGYQAIVERHLKRVSRPDSEFFVHGLLPGSYASDYPMSDLQYPTLALLHHTQVLAAAVAAERQGFDAFTMSFLNNGLLEEIRSAVDIPVANYAEAALHLASMYGSRFGIVRFSDDVSSHLKDFITLQGLDGRFAGVASAGFTFAELSKGFEEPEPIIARFREVCRQFVTQTGADVIIAGEMVLNVFLADHGVSRVDNTPVLDGCALVVSLAEQMADHRRKFGLSHSRAGNKNRRVPPERLDEVVAFYGLDAIWKTIDSLPRRK